MKTEAALFNLYAKQNIFTKFHIEVRYKRGRIWEFENLLPKEGEFLDLGCGHGVFANFLALSSAKRNVFGIDISESKISIAQSTVSNRPNINFSACDIANFNMAQQFDVITLIDVLYLIPYGIQEKILSLVYEHLVTSGLLLISEVCNARRLKFYKVLLQENISVKLLKITQGNKFYFRTDKQWQELLMRIGFSVSGVKRETSNPTNLYICRKQ